MGIVVITGCSSGFGLLAAKQLAERGDHVFATMRGPKGKNRPAADDLRGFAATTGAKLEVLDLDVTSDASVDAAAAAVLTSAGAPDAVINNAGQMYVGLSEAFTAEELTWQLDVNVVGIHRVCRAFLPAMRKRGAGLIINVSSIAGRMAVPFFGIYHASKWAVEGYSLAMRAELASSGVDVVVVEPGPFSTELFPQSPQPKDQDNRASSYPPEAEQAFEEMGAAFDELFNDPDVPTDPAAVVDRFVELIDMSPGTRPFRSVVGVDFGVAERNSTVEQHDQQILEAMALDEFARLRTT
jgi:NAD(P)-dependent dehydrogenase (short-subunit alcohol dehydrogenase family)